ncbi:MAG: SDR family oxidoreductase [Anaerolineae bacterium]|nr:SDR family oxidoreductase [Anaerolineae bacterium]
MTTYLIFGASRGIGAVCSRLLPVAGDVMWLVSRSLPDLSDDDGVKRHWIQADLSDVMSSTFIAQQLGAQSLDVCLYNAGIWEETAFSDTYDFTQVPLEETQRVLNVNLVSAITCTQAVLPALRRSSNAKIIFIGSNAGLENSRRPEVAYAATKFGLRGVTHALRECVRKDGIGVTCLNLGDVGGVWWENGQPQVETNNPDERLIAPNDIIVMLKAVIALSNASVVKEIDLLSMSESL